MLPTKSFAKVKSILKFRETIVRWFRQRERHTAEKDRQGERHTGRENDRQGERHAEREKETVG